MEIKPDYRTVAAFAAGGEAEEIDLPEGKAKVLAADLWDSARVRIGRHLFPLGDLGRARFVAALAEDGIHGAVAVPLAAEECQEALAQHERHTAALNGEFADYAAEYTSDEAMQEKVVRELWRLLRHASAG
jgi:hypothetical protein